MLRLIFVCVVGIAASLLSSAVWLRRKNIAEAAVMGIILWFSLHIFGSMALFIIDKYTIFRAAGGAMILSLILLAAVVMVRRTKPFRRGELLKLDMSLKHALIPLIVSVISLPFVSVSNEFFGMGQDEGVYQTQAISFMTGNVKKQKDFDEYHLLETDEERAHFEYYVTNHLGGWDKAPEDYPETSYDRSVSPVSGIYHGIPTYSALLALCGTIFGMAHMSDFEMLLYVCMIFLVYFVCRNLKLRRSVSACACIAAAASPIVIWVAKASLTEMFLTLLPLCFMYFMTDDDDPQSKWLSIVPVAVFACYHVSIYTVVPLFFIIYAAMYLFTREKQYAVLMPVLLGGYLVSYFAMRHVQPFYTMNNYRSVFVAGINVFNITLVVTAAVIAGLVASLVYIFILRRKTPKSFDQQAFLRTVSASRGFTVLLRLMLILPVAYILIRGAMKFGSWSEFSHLALLGYIANGGVFLIVAGLIAGTVGVKEFSASLPRLVLLVMFFYCVLVYSAFLRFDIQYYYYYSRYLAPFMPVAVIYSAAALDRFGWRMICPVTAAGLVYVSRFDGYLMFHRDDTRMEWSVLEDLTDFISEDDCLVISGNYSNYMWLPLRDLTGAAVYPCNADDPQQFAKLSARHGRVLYLTGDVLDDEYFSLIYTNKVKHEEDDLTDTAEFVPLSETFLLTEDRVQLYSYDRYKFIYTAAGDYDMFTGVSALEGTFCWSSEEEVMLTCGLYPDDYSLTITPHVGLPLDSIDGAQVEVTVLLNGEEIGTQAINSDNNGQPLSFAVPEELIEDGSNLLEIRSPLWPASAVSPGDDRYLGIPIESVAFAPA